MAESTERKLIDTGLLLLRLGIGGMFVWYGWPLIQGGAEKWTGLGHAMSFLGVTFLPAFWGFMAALSEFAGGICVMVGVFFRPMAALMTFTMAVAVTMHVHSGDPFMKMAPAIQLGTVMLALLLSGSGDFAIGKVFWGDGNKGSKASKASK